MAEPLISLLLERFTKVISQQVQEEVNVVGGVKKQADKLKSNLIDIQSVLEDAERKQVKETAVKVWLDKLKDVCYDMDDVLDEWSYAILTWKKGDDEENIHNQQKIRCSFLGSPCFCLNQVVRRRDIALKIKEVSEKVDEIANERARYGLQINRATDEIQRPTSTHIFYKSSISGRDGEKKSAVRMLLAESSQEAQDVDVISLVGLGGIGKTTLAQLAFNDAEVTAHFEKKIWVCVSEPFDEVRIAKAILEQLEGSTPNMAELQSLLPRVSQSINGKRVLLVLDDVWTENHRQWEQLKPSLAGCARGSRILVTTRKGAVATMIGTDHRIDIETLSDDACRSIFNHVAFHKRSKEERERLEDIGNKIANKCKGLPLAAKVLGGLMQSKNTREEWEDVLSSEVWGLNEVDKVQVEKKLFLPLLLSYYDLPSVVRRCFLYCAMFPKDYEMEKDELVKMWMAQGYLKGTGSRDMEVVGEQYFQVLAARSFFQDIEKYGVEDFQFKMHDIVHDFAQYMTENECLTVDGNNVEEASVKTSIERVRHLSMMLAGETSFPSSIHRAKGLRSLLIGNCVDPWLGVALRDVIMQLTCIRSLNLSRSSIEEIPKEVGKLIHLRHLNLEGCKKLVSLPETMCDLCNLQSLDVSECSSLKELPGATVKLVKLRHLRIDGSGVAFMPKGIERLTCLRTLDCFIVCGGGENESKAANLRELKNLNHIGGRLVIENLRGGGIEDDAEAQLIKNKKRLLCLELNFDSDSDGDILIEVLQPPSDLERLCIDNYGGIVLPNWMMALTRLQELQLSDCGNLEVLPPLGRLPNLESLELSMVGVRRLDAGFLGIEEVENANINEGEIARVTAFPKLRRLVIWNLSKLEEWDGIERRVGEEDATTTSIFIIMPQLQYLRIYKCPLLRALPTSKLVFLLAGCLQIPNSKLLFYAFMLLVRCTLNHIFIESRIRNGHFRRREKNPSSGDVKKWKSDRVYIDKHGKWRIFDHKKMSRKRCGSLRGQGWKYGSGFVDGIFPVLSPVAHQILNFVRKEVDPNNVWAALDTLPVTHETWDDLINVAVQLRLNKQWDPITLICQWILYKSSFQTDVMCYNLLIDGYGQKYLYKKAEETYVDLLQARCIPTEDTYALLIKAYCACGLLEKAEAAFVDMRKYGLPPSAIVYNAYIDGLMKAGNPQRAIEIFQRMKNDGCQPSTDTYTLLINLHGKASQSYMALKLFNEMRSKKCRPDICTYTALVNAFAREGLCEKAEEIFEQMQEDKLEPDVYTYNALMEAYSRAGFPYGAAEIFSLMRHMGCEPDRASYNIMVDAYGRAGLHEDAQAVFNEMKRLGITPTMKSHMLLLCAYSKARNVTKCEEIVNQMSESGLEPDTFVLNSMMHLYGQLGQFEKMEEVLTAMEKGPYEADISTYNILINIYGRAGFFERMEGIFHSLTTKNLKPDVVTWTSRLGAYSRKKLYRKCLEIFEEMIDAGCHPDGGTAKVLLSACSSEDQIEQVTTVIRTMHKGMEIALPA